jgi:hypothetical protein
MKRKDGSKMPRGERKTSINEVVIVPSEPVVSQTWNRPPRGNKNNTSKEKNAPTQTEVVKQKVKKLFQTEDFIYLSLRLRFHTLHLSYRRHYP